MEIASVHQPLNTTFHQITSSPLLIPPRRLLFYLHGLPSHGNPDYLILGIGY